MKILDWPRQSGKTTFLIKKAIAECLPVLVHHKSLVKIWQDKFNYPYIYYYPDQELDGSPLRAEFKYNKKWLVDEISLCHVPGWMQIEVATTTDRSIERQMNNYRMGDKTYE